MSNRWFRFVIALLAIGAAAAASYRIVQHEHDLAGAAAAMRAGEHAADAAIAAVAEIRAALHAYVAPGQDQDFWTARTSMLTGRLRGSLVELDRAAAVEGVGRDGDDDWAERLAAVDKRARAHVTGGRLLLAGEAIFTEARDVLDALRISVAATRDALVSNATRRQAEIRREQTLLALGAAAVLVLAVLVLVPPGRQNAPATSQLTPTAPVAPVAPVSVAPVAPAPPAAPVSVAPVAPVSVAPVSVSDAAAICTDMGRVSQSNELTGLLERAAGVLHASGVIVWVASDNRDLLYPAASAGYDPRLFQRLGPLRRDAANLTAAAFRGGTGRTSAGSDGSPAALAVPLLTPQGPVGILSAEFREVSVVDADRQALAAIFAAQLANLLGAISADSGMVGEARAQNA